MNARTRNRTPKPPKGRWARVWLSPEFVAFAGLHQQEPAKLAAAAAHSVGLRNHGTLIIHGPETPRAEYLESCRRLKG